MRGVNNTTGCWPTWQQELLLRAALLQGEDALSAWEKWKASVDVERLDPGSHNLLPLLYDNLATLGIKDSIMNKFKGVYRQTWYKNQLSIHRMSALLTAFHNVGIQTMVLKGAALLLLYYKNQGLRPMGDIDILVHAEQARRAIEVMTESGWIPEFKTPERRIPLSHAVAFKHPTTDEAIDLHWHVLHEGRHSRVDDKFWEGAVPARIKKVLTCALNSTDQLIHAFVHGIRWSPIPPFRWVADCVAIMNHSDSQIDWERLIIQVKDHRLILPVRDGLNYLRTKLDVPIPEAVLLTMQNMPTSRMERIEYSYKTHNYEPKYRYIPVIWFDFSRLRGKEALPLKLIAFSKYLYLRLLARSRQS